MKSTWRSPVAVTPLRSPRQTKTEDAFSADPPDLSEEAFSPIKYMDKGEKNKSNSPTPETSQTKTKEQLASWRSKRDRWYSSPRPKLKPLPTSVSTKTKSSLKETSPKNENPCLPPSLFGSKLASGRGLGEPNTSLVSGSNGNNFSKEISKTSVPLFGSASSFSSNGEKKTKPSVFGGFPNSSTRAQPDSNQTASSRASETDANNTATKPSETTATTNPTNRRIIKAVHKQQMTKMIATTKSNNPFGGINLVPSSSFPSSSFSFGTSKPTGEDSTPSASQISVTAKSPVATAKVSLGSTEMDSFDTLKSSTDSKETTSATLQESSTMNSRRIIKATRSTPSPGISNESSKNPFGSINLTPSTSIFATGSTSSLTGTAPSESSKPPNALPSFGTLTLKSSQKISDDKTKDLVEALESSSLSSATNGRRIVKVSTSKSSGVETKSSNPFGSINLTPSTNTVFSSVPKSSGTTPSNESKPSSSYPPMSKVPPKNPFGNPKEKAATPSSSSTYPPLSSVAPKNPFGGRKETTASKTSPSVSTSSSPSMSSSAPKNPFANAQPGAKPAPSPFSHPTMSNMAPQNPFGKSSKYPTSSSVSSKGVAELALTSVKSNEQKDDYRSRLLKFYEKHNPSKISSIDANLEKYKGKEEEMFRKLEAKYATPKVPHFPPPTGEGPQCYLEFSYGGEQTQSKKCRVVVKLFADKAPLAANNFKCLCTGEVTTHTAAGKPLRYLGSRVHRIVPSFCIQAGDFTKGNGTGGQSVYAPNTEHGDAWGKFKDETTGFLDHSRKGLLSMANSGKNSNSSQFFFTLKPVPYLNGKHVVFGEVIEGMDVLEEIQKIETDKASKPIQSVSISACGVIDKNGKDVPSAGTSEGNGEITASSISLFGIPKGTGFKSTNPFGNTISNTGASTSTPFSDFSSRSSNGSKGFGFGKNSSGSTIGGFATFTAPSSDAPAFGSPSKLGSGTNITARSTASFGFGDSSGKRSDSSTASFGFGSTSDKGSYSKMSGFAALATSSKASGFGSGSPSNVGGNTFAFGNSSTALGEGKSSIFGGTSAPTFGGKKDISTPTGGPSSSPFSSFPSSKGFSFGNQN